MRRRNKEYYKKFDYMVDVEKKLKTAMTKLDMIDYRVDTVEYMEQNELVHVLAVEAEQLDESLRGWK
tara:strand:+ start:1014 stop:1214 length:201 start_codon:yes stop_codon:yes gene_type:complete